MKSLIGALALLIGVVGAASAQDEILAQMTRGAEIVAHVKVLDVQGGEVEELGVQEWTALCEVVDPIKGTAEKGDKIRFRFTRFESLDHTEPKLVEKGKEYVIFLKGEAGGIRFPSDDKRYTAHKLLDRWLGALPYRFHLVYRLKEYLKDG